mmetsp:Transcript_109615/g.353845  ORF Transcript_109615/g.353845 Transcript_109615/m.353845 type:complete len:598 (-) Transcript_109615:135-1928(-)
MATGEAGGAFYVISDTHCETKSNVEWLQDLPEHPDDTIIVAGDIAVDLVQIEKALCLFQQKYKHVFYCFGNHECWTSKQQCLADGHSDSLGKVGSLRKLCKRLGVRTEAALVDGVWVVPVFGWYHNSFDTEPPLAAPPGMKLKMDPRDAEDISTDYITCKWGDLANGSEELAERLDAENEAWGSWPLPEQLLRDAEQPPGERQRPILSFSHFLPRLELHPEKRFLQQPGFLQLAGSSWIRRRVEELRPDLHVFGHTHFCWDMCLDGTRYRAWPLGMPDERHWRCMNFPIEEFDGMRPLKVMEPGGWQTPKVRLGLVSNIYDHLERDPSSCVMGHMVAGKFCPGAPTLFQDVLMPGRQVPWAMPEDKVQRERMARAARCVNNRPQRKHTTFPEWEVVGGADRGGVLVREAADLASEKLPERLSTGALVEQLALEGTRLFYRRLSGTGPKQGWVGISLPGKDLLVKRKEPPKAGDLCLNQILELQRRLLKRFNSSEFGSQLAALLQEYPPRQRVLAPFCKKRIELLQAAYDEVLPDYGFERGNLLQLDPILSPFCNLHTGNEEVKSNRRRIEELTGLRGEEAALPGGVAARHGDAVCGA